MGILLPLVWFTENENTQKNSKKLIWNNIGIAMLSNLEVYICLFLFFICNFQTKIKTKVESPNPSDIRLFKAQSKL